MHSVMLTHQQKLTDFWPKLVLVGHISLAPGRGTHQALPVEPQSTG